LAASWSNLRLWLLSVQPTSPKHDDEDDDDDDVDDDDGDDDKNVTSLKKDGNF